MYFDDALLALASYPDPTPSEDIDSAVRLAARVARHLTGVALQVRFPLTRHVLADYLIGLSDKAEMEEERSLQGCREALEHFSEAAARAGTLHEEVIDSCEFYEVAADLARRGRTYDVAIVPNAGLLDAQHEVAEALIFQSGRPVIVLRPGTVREGTDPLGLVAVAWDGSRAAARALGDAMPLLAIASEVRIVTFLNEKPEASSGVGDPAIRHLEKHGISARLEEVDTLGESIGSCLDAYARKVSPDLFVMGAYGHSRFREFMLGGATSHVLEAPPAPMFLSH